MSHLRRFVLRLLNAVLPGRAERHLAREVSSHLAMLEEGFRARGMTPDEARVAARRAFGGPGAVDQVRELQRDARAFRWLDDARRDVGYALRTLRRTPGFTTVAILTLTLGIGAVTIIYSVVRNVVLDPFPYPHSDRMVDVFVRDANGGMLRGPLPAVEFLDFQEQSQVFEDVAGTIVEGMHYTTGEGAERLSVAWVTPNAFAFLGVGPFIGRVLGPADSTPEAPSAAVLNHRTWMKMFGGDRAVVGRTIVLNHEPRTIVGVMPPRFEWHVADVWIPGPLSRTNSGAPRDRRYFQARLKRGVTTQEAEAQLQVIASRRAALYPGEYPERSRIQVITIIDWVVGQFRRVLYTLFAAVGLLLVIACCNVANMLLARATAREREISVRAALGASRGRIVRQLLVESAILAVGGVVGGCAFAYGGIDLLAGLMPRQGVAWETQLRLDRPVLFFAMGAAALATLAFGLFPALQSVRRELVGSMNSANRSGTANRQQKRVRSGLVVAEVTLSIVLLLGAGLLMRTFFALVGADLGFDPRNILITGATFPPGQTRSVAEQQRFYRQALDRVATIPGVLSASLSNTVPPFGGLRSSVEVSGVTADERSTAWVKFCSEEYPKTLGLRLVSGRQISSGDVEHSRAVALVNQALAKRYFGAEDPLGRVIRFPRLATLPEPVSDPSFEVIGVVADVANQGVRDVPHPEAIVPFTMSGRSQLILVARTSGEPMRLANTVRQEIRAVDRQVAPGEVQTLESILQRAFYAQPRFSLIVLGMFAVTGVMLVALGVYGVMAYTVSQQTRQIAIRMALGGERGHVLRMVFRHGLQLLGAGLVVGLAVSVATNRLLVNQLWNTSPHDPLTLAGGVAIVVFVGMLACWVPARRAMRVDPMVALRHE